MNHLRLILASATLGVGLVALAPASASAQITHTTPRAMRGTWYGYSKSYGFWEKIHVTKHSFRYSAEGQSYGMKGRHLSVVYGHRHGKTTVTFQYTGHVAATDSYHFGKAKVHGRYHTALIQDGTTAMFHSRVKSYYVPKAYRFI
ncbi:hypothetical protein YK48G_13500 [Lentilactobacillus fungorum]|uniref:Uncharacterized protein n=1 Tax=Lentilactobacillus fungorum TaxID=2201250 RepID=A0ABQ3VYE8_9LACO|nr:hypothetical protein [Lentilactobacillus fungorum]GHP13925.1 hypothetical protein YK48G_13500 [Lentilactobacillus fungorum]